MDMNAFSLKGKIAWITGASYGIDFAIAEAYAAAGAKIVFNDISRELVDKFAEIAGTPITSDEVLLSK